MITTSALRRWRNCSLLLLLAGCQTEPPPATALLTAEHFRTEPHGLPVHLASDDCEVFRVLPDGAGADDRAERSALLEPVRTALRLNSRTSRFNLFHLRCAGNRAYFEGSEGVPLDGSAWQESDLTVRALLVRAGSVWRVEVLWTLPRNDNFALAPFAQRLVTLRQTHHLPGALLP